jgi:carbamoyl-phosphate synthase large subunit
MESLNILFTCAGRRNYLINYFKEALNGEGKVIAVDSEHNAPALIDADIAINVPNIYSDNYIDEVLDICKEFNVAAVISLYDLELPIISQHVKDFEKIGTRVIVSNEGVIDIAFDKWKTHLFLREQGLQTPETYLDLQEAISDLNSGKLQFPLILKPRWGSNSIGIEIPQNMEELEYSYLLLKSKLTRTILKEASNQDINRSILIQQKLGGQEYGMDVLNDFEGNHIGVFARKKVSMRCGETDKAISVIDPNITFVGETIGKSLKHYGNLDCDVFVDEGNIYVLELNPRFGGGYPFSHEAGANTVATYLSWIKGESNYQRHLNYEADVEFVKCDRLLAVTLKKV